jgi:predicted Zn-dependent protease
MLRQTVCVLVIICGLVTGFAGSADAQQRLSFIRDAEIEDTIRTFVRPIFEAAAVTPEAVSIYMVDNPSLNAFVAGGQNMFLHTGLLMNARNAEELIGVMAHETGHLAGGHLARGQEAIEQARRNALLGTLLGIAAALAAGSADAGVAVIAGGQSFAERSLLSYSRAMENAADQAALTYMDRARMSSAGLMTFLETLEDQELVPVSRQIEYVQTHPLTRDRIDAVRTHVARSPYTDRPLPAGFEERFARMQAKLIGFLSPQVALRRYAADDPGVAARYARAIAAYRQGDLATGLAGIDRLLAEEPDNPFFHELKGQMLLENSRLAEARVHYQRAIDLYPGEPLLLVALAQTKLDTGDPADLQSAIRDLEQAVSADDGGSPFAWRLLATAYGRNGEMGMAALALAEEALAMGDNDLARQQALRAEQQLPHGSAGWLRAQDVQRAAEEP